MKEKRGESGERRCSML